MIRAQVHEHLLVSSKGQIVLRAELRRRLGLGTGTRLERLEKADGIRLRVQRPLPTTDIAALAGMAALDAFEAGLGLADSP